jgi:hypothetical protein
VDCVDTERMLFSAGIGIVRLLSDLDLDLVVECVDTERMLFSRSDVGIVRLLCDSGLGFDLAVECVDTERMLFSRVDVGIVRLLCESGLDFIGDGTSSPPAGSRELPLSKRMACMVDGPLQSSLSLHFFNFGD